MYGKFKGKTIIGTSIGQILKLAKNKGKGSLKIYSEGAESHKSRGGKKFTIDNPLIASFTIK